ncbi:MAG: ATP-binding protein [Acidobacteriota bacterium]
MSAERNPQVELSFGSDIAYLDLVEGTTNEIARLTGFNDEDLFWIALAVREAVANAIRHGNQGNPAIPVKVVYRWEPNHLKIEVYDKGRGIDESKIPDPLAPENLLKPEGRGIFFVRSFMDKVRFKVLPEGGHVVIMEKSVRKEQRGHHEN